MNMLSVANLYQGENVGKVRKGQEDSHCIELTTPNGMLFVVCDGMGGHVGGKMASSIAVESIVEFVSKQWIEDPYDVLKGALQFANEQILGYSKLHPEFKGMGTTACVLLLRDSGVYISHVGDSRIYLYLGKEKSIHRLTKDHSYVQTLVDQGEISDEEAERHPQKNRILKALGIKKEVEPSYNFQNKPIKPKDGDIFLICSDGLCGMVSDSQMQGILSTELSIEEKGNLLIQSALDAGGYDNVTVELILIGKSPYRRREFKSYNPREISVKSKFFLGGRYGRMFLTMLSLAGILGLAWIFYSTTYTQYSIAKEIDRITLELDMLKSDLRKWQSEKVETEGKLKENERRLQRMNEPAVGMSGNFSSTIDNLRQMEIVYSKKLSIIEDSISDYNSRIVELERKKTALSKDM